MHYAARHVDDVESQQQRDTSSWHDSTGTSFNESCTSLSPMQRLCGFALSSCVGAVLLLLAIIRLRPTNLAPFAILYSFGSLALIGAAAFLVGPTRQLRQMFRRYRWAATTVYLVLIGLTLAVALCRGIDKQLRLILCFVLVVLQFFAACWYALSYIPSARKAMRKGCTKCCGQRGVQ